MSRLFVVAVSSLASISIVDLVGLVVGFLTGLSTGLDKCFDAGLSAGLSAADDPACAAFNLFLNDFEVS